MCAPEFQQEHSKWSALLFGGWVLQVFCLPCSCSLTSGAFHSPQKSKLRLGKEGKDGRWSLIRASLTTAQQGVTGQVPLPAFWVTCASI